MQARSCSRLIISTDDPEIQEEALSLGVEVPFTRPAHLATDSASTDEVISHAIDWIDANGGERYDALMLLEPSSPFARADDYDAAVRIMVERAATVVVGVRQVEVNSVFVGPLDAEGRIGAIIHKMKGLRGLRRQDQEPECTMNGALYLVDWKNFRATRTRYCDPTSTYGLLMDRYHSIEIDEPIDLDWARFLVDRGYVDISHWKPTSDPLVK